MKKNVLNISIVIVAIILMGIFIPKMFQPAPVETVKSFFKAAKDGNVKQMNQYVDSSMQETGPATKEDASILKKLNISDIQLMSEEQNKAEVGFTSNIVLKGKKGRTKMKAQLKKEGSHWLISSMGLRETPVPASKH
jgi:hypothetical protein